MTFFRDAYQKFLANPRNAPLAADASLFYVASSTKFEGADAVITHISRHASFVKKSEKTISVIESSDSLVLDQETTLDFVNGGGVYLPSLDDSYFTSSVVTIPTVKIPRDRIPLIGCCRTNAHSCSSTSSTSMPKARFNKCASTGTKVSSSRWWV